MKFDEAFLRRLERLRLGVRRRMRGQRDGSHRSRRRGASVEFADHRPYVPGDDLRRIDWNAYARLEELVLRLYVAEDELRVYLLVDGSASMDFGEPSKFDVARRLAAGIAYVALHDSDRVRLMAMGAEGTVSETVRGRSGVSRMLRFLERMPCAGEAAFEGTVTRFLRQGHRPGLVFLMSDLFSFGDGGDSGEGEEVMPGLRAVGRLLAARFDVSLFHVLARSELEPELSGSHRLMDAETEKALDVFIDGPMLAAYEERVRTMLDGVEDYARRRAIAYLRLLSDEPVEERLLAHLRGHR